jgi:glycosyltransferase involved in cell wall biosynthesis
MSLTVVCTYLPLPPDRGDPVRVLMVLETLARVGRYTLLVVRRPGTTGAEVAALRDRLPGVLVRDYSPSPYRLGRLGPLGRYPEALGAGLPPWVRTRYSRELHADLLAATGTGLALGEAAGAYLAGTRLRWHWDKANVLAASARLDVAEAPDLPHRLRAQYLAAISRRYERRALAACATVSVTSGPESVRLTEQYGRSADLILPSAVPVPRGQAPAPREHNLVWLGSFGYRPNVLGLYRFLDTAWPALHRAGWHLTLVGSGLTAGTRARIGAYAGVRALGYVEDLGPVLAPARAAVVPLWTGAGVKLKTLTLLAHAVPVFSTPVGAEGIPTTPAVRVAEEPAELARQLLATPPAEFARMADAARSLTRTEFSERRFAERLTAFLAGPGYLEPAAGSG